MSQIPHKQVIELLNRHLGNKNWEISSFGEGRFSETFLARDGIADFVLRIAPPDSLLQLFYEYRMMRKEPEIHKLLHEHSDVPVPEIVSYDFSRKLINRDYLIMKRLPGNPMSNVFVSYKQQQRILEQLGYYVKQIHAVTNKENKFGYLVDEKECMQPQDSWPEAFRVMFRKELDDIVRTGIYSEKTADKIYHLLLEHLAVFEHCQTSCLLHGDLWVANILINENANITGILDFDRACWGDIEWDLAIAEYCGLLNDSFWKGYCKKIDTDKDDAAIRRMFYLLYEHQKYIVISISTRRNNPAGARRYADDVLQVLEHFVRTGEVDF